MKNQVGVNLITNIQRKKDGSRGQNSHQSILRDFLRKDKRNNCKNINERIQVFRQQFQNDIRKIFLLARTKNPGQSAVNDEDSNRQETNANYNTLYNRQVPLPTYKTSDRKKKMQITQ